MLAPDHQLYTHEEYFALEAQSEAKNEYHQGQIVAMAGASLEHNRIAGNIFNVISNSIKAKPCEVFMSDLRVWIEKNNRYVYPDVTVVCGKPQLLEGRPDTITNPQIIIEVLSETTESIDRGDKFRAYWTLDPLAEYILIDQYRRRVEYFRRLDEKTWELRVLTKQDDVLALQSIAIDIPLPAIYRNVTWEE